MSSDAAMIAVGPKKLTAEASTLGWKPGEWPEEFDGWVRTRIVHDYAPGLELGDVVYVIYMHPDKGTLNVFND